MPPPDQPLPDITIALTVVRVVVLLLPLVVVAVLAVPRSQERRTIALITVTLALGAFGNVVSIVGDELIAQAVRVAASCFVALMAFELWRRTRTPA